MVLDAGGVGPVCMGEAIAGEASRFGKLVSLAP